MARGTSIQRRQNFLPIELKAFVRRRGEELIGIGLVALAMFLALSLASFDPGDPSLNHATGGPVSNILGLFGASLADILLQTTGLASVAIVIVLLAWAWRIGSHRGLPLFLINLSLSPITLIFLTGTLASFGYVESWPLRVGLGGLLGDLVLGWTISLAHAAGSPVGLFAVGLGLGIPALVALIYTLGITLDEWRAIRHFIGRCLIRTLDASIVAIAFCREKLARWRDGEGNDAAPEPEARNRRTRRRKRRSRDTQVEPVLSTARVSEPKVERSTAKPRASKREEAERQSKLDLNIEGVQLPELAILHARPKDGSAPEVGEEALEQNARLLETVLQDFGVHGEIVTVRPGPVVTLYELEPAPGTKSSRVIGLADDIARSMSAISARVSVIPGRNAIGIELPNSNREIVYLRELLATADYERANGQLTMALGKDIGGAPQFADLARMPHLLIAGTTGSGKSVAVNVMILSLLYRLTPEECRLIMIDPKMLELSIYDGIPHLLAPVVTDPHKAIVALKWTVREMETRYRKMSELGVRNVSSYNQRIKEATEKGEDLRRTVQTGFDEATGEPVFEDRPLEMERLPLIVVIVDEMADLMMVAGKEIEGAIQRLAQMARAAGIHLIMATQRPSVDVITGTIKANFPTRISFQVTSKIDSRTILGEQGAEQLLGAGDMLFMPGAGRITRIHGPFVSDEEVERVVTHWKRQGAPEYLDDVTKDVDSGSMGGGMQAASSGDSLYDRAVDLVARERKASTSFVQRHLQIGYNRAARIIEQMEQEGIIGPANHVGKREVLAREPDEFD